ncbi:hypothetical protein [Streptomyces goshikiensis]
MNWSRITTGVEGNTAVVIDGFWTVGSVSRTRHASVGADVVLLALPSIVMLAGAPPPRR